MLLHPFLREECINFFSAILFVIAPLLRTTHQKLMRHSCFANNITHLIDSLSSPHLHLKAVVTKIFCALGNSNLVSVVIELSLSHVFLHVSVHVANLRGIGLHLNFSIWAGSSFIMLLIFNVYSIIAWFT